MLPTEQALSLLPPERFRLLPATQPEACTKTLNSYNYFCKFPVTPDTFGAKICLSSFYACQEMCQKRVSKNLLTRFLTACSNYPKTNSACLSQRQPPEKAIRKDYSRFCSRVHIIFPTAKRIFPLQNKNQVQELIC